MHTNPLFFLLPRKYQRLAMLVCNIFKGKKNPLKSGTISAKKFTNVSWKRTWHLHEKQHIIHWWFGTFFSPYIGNNHPNWLIFFRGVGIPPSRHFSEQTWPRLGPVGSQVVSTWATAARCWAVLCRWTEAALHPVPKWCHGELGRADIPLSNWTKVLLAEI